MKPANWWLIGAIVAVLLLTGGGVLVYQAIDREKAKKLLGDAFAKVGLPREWGIAIGMVETNLKSNLTNMTGPDLARGGAYGLTQITEKTARAHGYLGKMSALLEKPELAAELSAKIAAAGSPKSIEDLGAWWNAGRKTASALAPGHVTLEKYIPRLKDALGKV